MMDSQNEGCGEKRGREKRGRSLTLDKQQKGEDKER